jgi:hypothetical protein
MLKHMSCHSYQAVNAMDFFRAGMRLHEAIDGHAKEVVWAMH